MDKTEKLIDIFHVQINYKSGIQMNFWCREFKYKYDTSDGVFTHVSWMPNGSKTPLAINLAGIESIWQLDAGRVTESESDNF